MEIVENNLRSWEIEMKKTRRLIFVSVKRIYFNYSYTAKVPFFIKRTLYLILSSYRYQHEES